MDKGKTTRILSGGTYIGKDGKLHKWRKIHGYKPAKITDDNWMEYGMPSDDETNESKNMSKKVIRLTEGDLHKIIKESVKRVLREESRYNEEIMNKIIDAYNEAVKWSNSIYGNGNWKPIFISSLAWMIIDNGLTVKDMANYGNVLEVIDANELQQEVNNIIKYKEFDERDDKRREAEAWAEERMSDMGFGFEGD